MKTLLTGFNRFGNLARNPSQLVVEEMARRAKQGVVSELIVEVLPTEFALAGERITQLIREHRPGLIICLGVAQGTEAIHLERVALNLDDTESPDNAGRAHQGKMIVADGPVAYWSTLPLEDMSQALSRRGIPSRISNHAGTYVCNHVFYRARREVELLGLACPCGFIHLPGIVDGAGKRSAPEAGLPFETMVDAIECCLAFARNSRT